MQELDPTIRRGTFTVTTESGGVYTVVTTKNVAGLMIVSGGSRSIASREAVSREGAVVIGQPMDLHEPARPERTIVYTSSVRSIERVD